ncbi:hypothetical protein ASE92_11940 [Pedobacter sp. Leaf41]|uniref:HsdM family class I SAM-dependent methyltransferase n=1 Tax=Pedobacter sp. Leaf41 TaxID=1736218 RepID=UPI000702A2F1|nr:N-6 DNA methylase [Pedobacter sp. Leaf41]KQN34315.1 hypothetical protein ASE92_11940 [Pedobacter sp. Leaf41]
MINLSEILTWKKKFGLLPIKLKPTDETTYILLNGGYGDFCLQTIDEEKELGDYFSKSWSSSTKNFVVLDDNKLKIFNWSKQNSIPEEISLKNVLENFDKFYTYLLSKSYKSEKDVVPFIIDIFRQLRNLTQERTNPVEALNLLFVLLTSIEEDSTKLDTEKWNLQQINIPDNFNFFSDKMRNGIDSIKPELELILRHSAGILFQEAQKEVLFFNPQRDLFGGVSSLLETKVNLYSSIHYTPPYLARTIVENALRKVDLNLSSIKIFDPACGSCEFLIEVLKQLKELNYAGEIRLVGWDSSETAINTSNFLLKYEQRTVWNDKLDFQVKLVNDSLSEIWDNDFDLILMNPPFVSWELLDKQSKDVVKNTLDNVFVGKPNQASAFFYKCIQNLNDGGIIGCVVPSSLLSLDAYKKLRMEAFDLISISLIGKLGNFVFEDALTDVSLLIGHRPKVNILTTVLWARNEKGVAQEALRDLRKMYYSNALTIDERNYSIFQPIDFPIIQGSWKPISLDENKLFKNIERYVLEKRLVRVEDVFGVQQGIRTGKNKVFIISSSEFENLPEKEKIYFRPSADNESIRNGSVKIINYVWYPYNEKGTLIKTEEEFEKEAPTFFLKLFPLKDMLADRARKSENSWWLLSEPRAWLRENKSRLISSEFGKSDSFAFDKTGRFAVERGNAWLPKKAFTNSDYYFYLAIFSSPLFDSLLSIYSKQLLSGWDLGRKYTKDIPLPDVKNSDVRNSLGYDGLVQIGLGLSEGNQYMKLLINEVLFKYFYPD